MNQSKRFFTAVKIYIFDRKFNESWQKIEF